MNFIKSNLETFAGLAFCGICLAFLGLEKGPNLLVPFAFFMAGFLACLLALVQKIFKF